MDVVWIAQAIITKIISKNDKLKSSMSSKILIIFPYSWLPYFSTLLNLYEILSKHFDVQVVTFEPIYFTNVKLGNLNVKYIKTPKFLVFLLSWCSKLLWHFRINFDWNPWLKAVLLWFYILPFKPKEIIAADSLCLWVAQLMVKQPHFLCVDITEGDIFIKYIKKERIKSVIISNEERYKYLFGDFKIPYFIVENCPVYKPLANPIPLESRSGLVYCGTSIPQWGIYEYLDFISEYGEDTLTIQGSIPSEVKKQIDSKYAQLCATKQLIISSSYIEYNSLPSFLNQFRIGFCLYNIDNIHPSKKFNQLYGSYGKLYSYYSAGVPVIATKIPGMCSVEEFNTGVLIEDHTPAEIKHAIAKIESNYSVYVANCFEAARYYDFNSQISPFIKFISSSLE